MNKLLIALVASAFAFGSAASFAADAAKKKEELTTEQKTEIRDRVERMKAERTKTESAKPAEPAKATAPKRTSKQGTSTFAKTTPKVTNNTAKKAPAKA